MDWIAKVRDSVVVYLVPSIARHVSTYLGGVLSGLGLSGALVTNWMSLTQQVLVGVFIYALGQLASVVRAHQSWQLDRMLNRD